MDESKFESLLQAIRDERIASGVEQPNNLEQLVEAIVEKQTVLRQDYEKLSGEIQKLQETLTPLPDPDVALYISVASLIISILAVAAIFFLKNHLERECNIKDRLTEKKIDELNREIQQLKLVKNAFDDKSRSFEKKIDELNRDIQRLNAAKNALDDKNRSFEKEIDKRDQEIQRLKEPPPPPPPPLLTNTSFTNEFNTLMSLKTDSTFSKKRDDFRQKYNISAFSCANSQELIQDSDVEPKFKENVTNNGGDYWAYASGDCCEVVPSPYLQSYTDIVNIGRAFGKVFESNFKFGGYFTSIKVKKPALFKKSGSQWILQSRGILLLE